MKKTAIASVALILIFSVFGSNAYAGRGGHERWEGVAIGLTAAIIGSALIHQSQDRHHQTHRRSSVTIYKSSPPRHHKKYERFPRHGRRHSSSVTVHGYAPPRHHGRYDRSHHRPGHWEVRKVWVPPAYEKVWNPGHYNKRGHWKPSRWVRVEISPGYWKKERIWVPHR